METANRPTPCLLLPLRTEAEARAVRARVVAKALSCPFCGADVGLARQVNGVFLVGCEADECHANPQVSARDLATAWTRWNTRAPGMAELEAAGAGSPI